MTDGGGVPHFYTTAASHPDQIRPLYGGHGGHGGHKSNGNEAAVIRKHVIQQQTGRRTTIEYVHTVRSH